MRAPSSATFAGDLRLGQQDVRDVTLEVDRSGGHRPSWPQAPRGRPGLGRGVGGPAPITRAAGGAAGAAATASRRGRFQCRRARAAARPGPDDPDRPSTRAMLPVLEHQRPEIARVEQLDVDRRVELAQAPQLAVLLAHEPLAECRHLEVEVEVGQVEVRREALDDGPVEVPEDREGVRLVLPADRVEVEDAGHLRLAGVGERRTRLHRRPVYPSGRLPGDLIPPGGTEV